MKPRTPGFWLIVATVGLLGFTVLLSGCMHSTGGRTPAPFESFVARAEQGDARAQYLVASYYATGRGVVKDEVQAVKWYRKAAVQGNAQAQYSLGFHYVRSLGVAGDDVEAAKWWRKAADQGHADAQYALGNCYAHGQGVTEDGVEAVKWYRKAAEQGDAQAQHLLAYRYSKGLGIAKDNVEAAKWYRMAAEQGDTASQTALGECYAEGLGVVRNEVEAKAYLYLSEINSEKTANSQTQLLPYEAASRAGQRAKELEIGIQAKMTEAAMRAEEQASPSLEKYFPSPLPKYSMSAGGGGFDHMSPSAVKYFNDAKGKADQGETGSYGKLANCYDYGIGVAKDEAEAVKWHHRSADLGDRGARLYLAQLYFEGRGVAIDEIKAYAFLTLAGDAADLHGDLLDAVKHSLSPSERLRGRQLARNLKKEADANIAAKKAGK